VGRDDEQPAPLEPDTPVVVAEAAAGTIAGARSHTVFLVATLEEAGQVAANMEALDDDRRFGEVTMLVVAADDQAHQLRSFVADLNRVRNAEGLPPIQLVDARQRPAL
jgi:hypothetical protein